MSLSQIFVHIHLFNFYFFIFTHFRGWGDDLFQLKKLTRTLARCKDKFSQLRGGFGAVLRVFWITFLQKEWRGGWSKNSQNGSKTTQKTRKDDNDQLKYKLAVLFSLKFIFNPKEWVTCDKLKGHSGWKGFYFYFLFVWSPSFSDHCICTVCLLFHKVR